MKKIISVAAVLALLAGCAEEQVGPKYATNLTPITEYLVSGACVHIGAGARGDYVMKCTPNSVFADAMAAQKTVKFLSVDIDVDAALADMAHVYVNVVPTDACPMRIAVPGDAVNGRYASVVCPEGYVAE